MADTIPVEHVEQIALWKQWVAQKQRGLPAALRAWERHLLSWDARDPLDRDSWIHLRRWAQKSGLVQKTPLAAPRGQFRDEI